MSTRVQRETLPREVFEDLVRRHHLAVYRTALRVTRSEADAADAAQQVFLAVLERRIELDRAEDPARVLAWWAVRTALALLRGARNTRRREESFAMQHAERTFERSAEREEEQQALARLVGALPEELRVPVELRFREEWTLGAIGAALELSEPSVHERLKRALDRLRRELGQLGFGAFALNVEAELARDAAVAAPAGLAGQLLALQGASSGFAALPALAVAAGLAAALVVVAWIAAPGGSERGGERVAEVAPLAHVPAADARDAEPGAAAAAPADGTRPARAAAALPAATQEGVPAARSLSASIQGRVVDELGFGVGGATVRAAPPGKGFPWMDASGQAVTRPDGTYTLPLALREARQTLQFAVEHAEYVLAEGPLLRVSAGANERAADLVLRRVAVDPPGEFTVALRVVDPDGAPLAGLAVRLFRRGKSAFGGAGQEWEAGGLTGADGSIELAGKWLGEKLLVLDAREHGWRLARERFTVAAAGRTQRVLRAERGAVLAGTVRALDGAPLAKCTLNAAPVAEGGGEYAFAETDAAGRFEIVGLDPVPTRLHVGGGGCSNAELELTPSRTDLDVRLKLSTDPTDAGEHMAELHGRVIDARTRKPVLVEYDALDAVPVVSTSRAEFLAREAVTLLVERPYQTMVSGDWTPPPPTSAFHQTGLRAGNYVLVARVRGFAPSFAGPFELGERTVRADVELALEAPAKLAVRVLDARGEPVRGALVVLAGAVRDDELDTAESDAEVQKTEGHPRFWYDAHTTGADGRFDTLATPGIGVRPVVYAFGRRPSVGVPLTLGAEGAVLEPRVGPPR